MKILILTGILLSAHFAMACWQEGAEDYGPPMNCTADQYGYVNLEYTEILADNKTQKFALRVGQEQDWNNPNKVRNLCEKVKNSIQTKVDERWSQGECYGDNAEIFFKEIGYQLNDSRVVWLKAQLPENFNSNKTEDVNNVNKDFFKILKPTQNPICYYP